MESLEDSTIAASRTAASRSRLAWVMSRIAAVTQVPCSVSSGLRLISMGNSLPSERRPDNSSPAPISRTLGAWKKPER